jgi:hypothetical protein
LLDEQSARTFSKRRALAGVKRVLGALREKVTKQRMKRRTLRAS